MLLKLKPVIQRIIIIIGSIIISSIGIIFILKALNDNIVLYASPTDLLQNNYSNKKTRLGGIVKKNSIKIKNEFLEFTIHDNRSEIKVFYTGVVPSLFREDQEAVVYGFKRGNEFVAEELLAKHDENYKPLQLN